MQLQIPQTIEGCVDGLISQYPKMHKGSYGEEMIHFPKIDDNTKYFIADDIFEKYGMSEFPTAIKIVRFLRKRIEQDSIAINDFASDYAKYKAEYESSLPKLRIASCNREYYEKDPEYNFKYCFENKVEYFERFFGRSLGYAEEHFVSKGIYEPPVEYYD